MATSQPTASKRCLRHHRAAVTARVSVVSTAVSPRWVECAKPPQGRHVCMQAQLLRNAFVHPAPGARALPALGQLCHQRAPASRAQAAAAMLSSITVVALAA